MTKKALILGLFSAVLVSSVGGAFEGVPAQASHRLRELYCTVDNLSVNSGQWVGLSAGYAYDQYPTNRLTWSAVGGHPDSGTGTTFATRFFTSSINETRIVTVSDGYQTASCVVYVFGTQPTPTPTPVPSFSLDHTVRNESRGGNDRVSVTAYHGDYLRFTTRISMDDAYGEDVHIRDWLPSYTQYVYGSTTVDGGAYQDGIATGHSGDSLALGALAPNRTVVVRFLAVVKTNTNATLTNSVNVHVRNAPVQNRTATVRFVGSDSPTPTPTPTVTVTPTPYPTGGSLALTMVGRNNTAGQSGEYATVHARDGNTLEFILRVRSQSGGVLNNVFVTDYLPSGMTYVNSSTALNGYVVADGITSTGLNIGTLAPGQTATIRFSVQIEPGSVPTVGTVSVSNTAQARADGLGSTSARMTVTLGQAQAFAAAGLQTGPESSLLLALFAAFVATGIYAGYTRTNMFGRRMATSEIGRLARKTEMNFSK